MESERESENRYEALYLIGSENELSRTLQVHSLLENLKQKSRNQGMVKKQIDSSCQVSRLPTAFYSSLIVKYYHRTFYNPDLKPFLFYHPLRRMWGISGLAIAEVLWFNFPGAFLHCCYHHPLPTMVPGLLLLFSH